MTARGYISKSHVTCVIHMCSLIPMLIGGTTIGLDQYKCWTGSLQQSEAGPNKRNCITNVQRQQFTMLTHSPQHTTVYQTTPV